MGVIDIKPPSLTSYQKDILFSKARFTITEASTKVGKTHSHIIWLYGKAHEFEVALNYQYWWVAPVYSQTKIAYKRLKHNLIKTGLYKFNDTELRILFPNGAEMHFKTAEKVDNLYGENVYACVLDEAPRMRATVWAAIRSTLTSTKGPCKLIGNFGGISNWVHKLKDKAEVDPMYAYFRVTCWDGIKAGILDEDEVLQAQRDLPVKIFEELYEAKASESEGQLIKLRSLKYLFKPFTDGDDDHYITCDPARMGKDKTVIMVWRGLNVIKVIEYATSKATLIIDKINELKDEYSVRLSHITLDENGLGGPIIDVIKCNGFLNNGKPIKVSGSKIQYANLKAQCYFKLADEINAGKIGIRCTEPVEIAITEELEWVRLAKQIDTSKLNIMSKDEVKRWLGRSPDYSDSLMMRMVHEIGHKGQYSSPRRSNNIKKKQLDIW